MKTNIVIALTDDQRAQIRAGMNRGGLATREEIRIFVHRVVSAALEALPPPKRRRITTAAEGLAVVTASVARRRRAAAELADPQSICLHCRKLKDAHGKMAFTCPPASGRPKGQTFESIDPL